MTHSRRRSRRRLLGLIPLLAMASTTSALNLSQFQIITSNQIPKRCIRAYQSDIEGCTRNDFTNGRQCSASCVKGLQETEELINEACGDLNVNPKSLLGIVLSGGLVDVLCPGFGPTTITTTVQPSPTSPKGGGGFSTIVPAPTTTRSETSRTTKAPPTASPSTSRTSDQSTTVQSTTDQETSSSTTESESSTSSLSSTDATSTLSSTQSTATSEAAQSPSPTPPSDNSQGDTPTPFIGGSPFDPAPIQNIGTAIRSACSTEALVAAIFAAILIIR
ncbi:hypothetical protein GGS26DRAFT_274472 [Hypomontagnella submonticulosa]|nr:hypothetical protein GGS26DRAFT_274472 [Hypomontagnella submonticulosa]